MFGKKIRENINGKLYIFLIQKSSFELVIFLGFKYTKSKLLLIPLTIVSRKLKNLHEMESDGFYDDLQ